MLVGAFLDKSCVCVIKFCSSYTSYVVNFLFRSRTGVLKDHHTCFIQHRVGTSLDEDREVFACVLHHQSCSSVSHRGRCIPVHQYSCCTSLTAWSAIRVHSRELVCHLVWKPDKITVYTFLSPQTDKRCAKSTATRSGNCAISSLFLSLSFCLTSLPSLPPLPRPSSFFSSLYPHTHAKQLSEVHRYQMFVLLHLAQVMSSLITHSLSLARAVAHGIGMLMFF